MEHDLNRDFFGRRRVHIASTSNGYSFNNSSRDHDRYLRDTSNDDVFTAPNVESTLQPDSEQRAVPLSHRVAELDLSSEPGSRTNEPDLVTVEVQPFTSSESLSELASIGSSEISKSGHEQEIQDDHTQVSDQNSSEASNQLPTQDLVMIDNDEEDEPVNLYRDRTDRVLLGEWVDENSPDRTAVYGYLSTIKALIAVRVKETRDGVPIPYFEWNTVPIVAAMAPEVYFERHLVGFTREMLKEFVSQRLEQMAAGEDPQLRYARDEDAAERIRIAALEKTLSQNDTNNYSRKFPDSPCAGKSSAQVSTPKSRRLFSPTSLASPFSPTSQPPTPSSPGVKNLYNFGGDAILLGACKHDPDTPVFAVPDIGGKMKAYMPQKRSKMNAMTVEELVSAGRKCKLEDVDLEGQFEGLTLDEAKKVLRQHFFTSWTPATRAWTSLQTPVGYSQSGAPILNGCTSPTITQLDTTVQKVIPAFFKTANEVIAENTHYIKRSRGELKGFYVAESHKHMVFENGHYFRKYKCLQEIEDEVIMNDGSAYVLQDSSLYEKKSQVLVSGNRYFEVLELLYAAEL